MKVPFLDITAQYHSIKPEIDKAIASVIETSSYIGGVAHQTFKTNFSEFIGIRNTVLVGNGTDALIIALKSLRLPPQSEVIVPANSFIATSEAVTAAGYRVVFCDISDETFNLDTDKIIPLITPKTKAVIAVHLYGQPCDVVKIKSICESYKLYLIEDCAQAHGALYGDRIVGTFGDISTFSFYPGKNLGAYGDGGAIVTDNDDLALFCQKYANHGRLTKYNHEFEGVNSRLDTLQSAVLDVKLKHLPDWNNARRAIAKRYSENLTDPGWLHPQVELPGSCGVYHLYTIRVKNRERFIEYLRTKDIGSVIHYPIGLPFLKAYDYLGHARVDFPVTSAHQDEILSLPIYPEMTHEMITYIIDVIRAYDYKPQ